MKTKLSNTYLITRLYGIPVLCKQIGTHKGLPEYRVIETPHSRRSFFDFCAEPRPDDILFTAERDDEARMKILEQYAAEYI